MSTTNFIQSWHQRMRWAKGYLQMYRRYGGQAVFGDAAELRLF